MLLRARHLLAAWIAYGVLQFALLGVVGAAGTASEHAARDARARSESPAMSFGKRTFAAEVREHRHTPAPPFAPSAYVRWDLVALDWTSELPQPSDHRRARHTRVLPPSRAPPALS